MAGADGDERAAFEGLFDATYPRCVLVACRILGDPARAEEVASEAFARAWARWRAVQRHPSPSGWVVRTASNLALDLARRGPPPAAGVPAPAPEADIVVLRLALVQALRHLPARQRDTIVLRYLADLPEQDVAHALGISNGSVKTHLHRGLARLRTTIGPDDPYVELTSDP